MSSARIQAAMNEANMVEMVDPKPNENHSKHVPERSQDSHENKPNPLDLLFLKDLKDCLAIIEEMSANKEKIIRPVTMQHSLFTGFCILIIFMSMGEVSICIALASLLTQKFQRDFIQYLKSYLMSLQKTHSDNQAALDRLLEEEKPIIDQINLFDSKIDELNSEWYKPFSQVESTNQLTGNCQHGAQNGDWFTVDRYAYNSKNVYCWFEKTNVVHPVKRCAAISQEQCELSKQIKGYFIEDKKYSYPIQMLSFENRANELEQIHIKEKINHESRIEPYSAIAAGVVIFISLCGIGFLAYQWNRSRKDLKEKRNNHSLLAEQMKVPPGQDKASPNQEKMMAVMIKLNIPQTEIDTMTITQFSERLQNEIKKREGIISLMMSVNKEGSMIHRLFEVKHDIIPMINDHANAFIRYKKP